MTLNRVVVPMWERCAKIFGLILLFSPLLSFDTFAQAVGDYRSDDNNFNWNADNDWQRYNGSNWVTPTAAQGYPGETVNSIAGTVTIRTGHIVNITADVALSIGNLVVEGTGTINFNTNGADIDVNGTLTMDGTSQITGNGATRTLTADLFSVPATASNARIAGSTLTINGTSSILGTVTFNTNSGVKTFIGTVTNNGSWTSTTVAAAGGLIFRNGVSSTGTTFAAGTATLVSGAMPPCHLPAQFQLLQG
jgi:hypothetical protein